MKYIGALAAIAGAVSAQGVSFTVPANSSTTTSTRSSEENPVVPTLATASLLAAVPSSLQASISASPTCAEQILYAGILNSSATWFSNLPTAVQSYFASQSAPSSIAGCVYPTVTPIVNLTVSGNVTSSITSSVLVNRTTTVAQTTTTGNISVTASISSSSSSSSSSGMATVPSAMVGPGLAGVFGLIGMMAL